MKPRTLHPNTTQFPNVLLDAFLHLLSPSEWKVLSYIVRRTYGWQREREVIPYAQMENGRVSKDGKIIDAGTGLTRPTLAKALNVLLTIGLLNSEGEKTQSKTYWLMLTIDLDAITDERLCAAREEYERKLQSAQMKMKLDTPKRQKWTGNPSLTPTLDPLVIIAESPPSPRSSIEKRDQTRRLALLIMDVENIRKGRVTPSSVARRRKVPVGVIERMIPGDDLPTLAQLDEIAV